MHFEGICGLKTELNYPFKQKFAIRNALQEERERERDRGRGKLSFSFCTRLKSKTLTNIGNISVVYSNCVRPLLDIL